MYLTQLKTSFHTRTTLDIMSSRANESSSDHALVAIPKKKLYLSVAHLEKKLFLFSASFKTYYSSNVKTTQLHNLLGIIRVHLTFTIKRYVYVSKSKTFNL
jgi:hypothetical protein